MLHVLPSAALLCLPLLHQAAALAAPSPAVAADEARWAPACAAIDGIAAEALAQEGAVGLSVAVAVGEEMVLARGYGLAEAEHAVPVDEHTLFRIGSITKQFTAAAVVRLAERGELDLDGELTAYLPDFPTQGNTVTLRHLLTHTSGIQSYTGLGPGWLRTVPLELAHEELLALFKDEPFEFEPGARFAYCNSGYYLLGMVVERVSGQDYATHVRTVFSEPLGLGRLRYDSNSDVIPNRAQGYRLVDGQLANDGLIGMSQPGAAGALIASARELVLWQLALVSGRVVSPAAYEEMTTPFLLSDFSETRYGMGLGVEQEGGRRRIGHGGGINGFNSQLQHYPDAGLSVAVLSNSEALSSAMVEERIAQLLLAELEAATPAESASR